MKKIIITAVFILIVILGYIAIGNNQNNIEEQTVENSSSMIRSDKLGFNYTPPEGWKLWEGVSAARNAPYYDSSFEADVYKDVDRERLQNYLSKWEPSESEVLIFTSSSTVDLKRRDIEYLGLMGNKIFIDEEKPLIFNMFRLDTSETPIKYVDPQKLEDREFRQFESENVVGKIQEVRAYLPEYDLILVFVPFGEKTITFSRNVEKGENSEAEELVSGISFLQ